MKCFKCGCTLTEKDYCTGCGADVRMYKRIIRISNALYNQGLEKANVRDLSGAVICLKQSLKYNKYNSKARNLLGLVYYEMGEMVAALSEWVISKNFKSQKNIADDYIKEIQDHPNRLDAINQTIKKYNQALLFCKQGSEDLAIIQLKKVLSLNPKLIKAYQLLGLLYLKAGDKEQAKKTLQKASEIDINNTTTLRYMQEINAYTPAEETKEKEKNDASYKYQSGNETIIQPISNGRLSNGMSSIVNVIVGIVIGLAIGIFLIVPARTFAIKSDVNKSLIEVSDQLSESNTKVKELEGQVTTLTQENTTLSDKVNKYENDQGIIQEYDYLLTAASLYIGNKTDVVPIFDQLSKINQEFLNGDSSATFKSVYNLINTDVSAKAEGSYMSTASSAYKSGDYATAISYYDKVFTLNPQNEEALYQLGNAYRKSGDTAKANETYKKVMELFPNTSRASDASSHISE